VRGRCAIESLARLGLPGDVLTEAVAAFERRAAELGARAPAPLSATGIPVRAAVGALEFLPHLLPGYERLTVEERDELRHLLGALPGGTTSVDIAWSACDGRRSLEAIADLCSLEQGAPVPVGSRDPGSVGIARLFALTERCGLSRMAESGVAAGT
jgi:hypothetical protein